MVERSEAGPSGPGESSAFDERSASEVTASLVANLQALIRTELELAKLELKGIVRDKAVAIGLIVTAGLFGLFVLGFVGVTGANALMLVLPAWAAWLIVTAIYLLIAVALVLVAVRLLKRPFVPERTKQELTRTVSWAKEQVRS